MKFEKLTEINLNNYIVFLKKAFLEEPELMMCDSIDEESLKKRITDSFYKNTQSILAISDGMVVGRIEYHFYGCLQDGFKMAYVDWIYVLKEFRQQGIASALFQEFERECKEYDIDQYYLIQAENNEAQSFYKSFQGVTIDKEAVLRKTFIK